MHWSQVKGEGYFRMTQAESTSLYLYLPRIVLVKIYIEMPTVSQDGDQHQALE